MNKLNNFDNKTSFFKYLKKLFQDSNTIILTGSMVHKSIKNFSDFDLEVYGKSIKKPYYELVWISGKLVLLSAYFYKFEKGISKAPPKGTKIIKGEYNTAINKRTPATLYSEGKYSSKEVIRRECQLVADFLFKYFRSKNKKYLQYVQKRIN
ncbi:MAG: hypothetical protein Q8Q42_00045 [Nanoarchaeota archaeon]|nr:hypothetical protein [Nanoarchaeota archaeon]